MLDVVSKRKLVLMLLRQAKRLDSSKVIDYKLKIGKKRHLVTTHH